MKILVPNSTAGMIIGKGGTYIKQIKEESGAYVQISQKAKDQSLAERCITVICKSCSFLWYILYKVCTHQTLRLPFPKYRQIYICMQLNPLFGIFGELHLWVSHILKLYISIWLLSSNQPYVHTITTLINVGETRCGVMQSCVWVREQGEVSADCSIVPLF